MDDVTTKIIIGLGGLIAIWIFVEILLAVSLTKTSDAVTKTLGERRILTKLKNRTLAGNAFYYYCCFVYILWLVMMAYIIPNNIKDGWDFDNIAGFCLIILITYKLTRYLLQLRGLRNHRKTQLGTTAKKSADLVLPCDSGNIPNQHQE